MSRLRTVRKDDKGLHVFADGWVLRPPCEGYMEHTRHREGEKVKARHIGGTSTGKVGRERWSIRDSEMTPEARKGYLNHRELYPEGKRHDRH